MIKFLFWKTAPRWGFGNVDRSRNILKRFPIMVTQEDESEAGSKNRAV